MDLYEFDSDSDCGSDDESDSGLRCRSATAQEAATSNAALLFGDARRHFMIKIMTGLDAVLHYEAKVRRLAQDLDDGDGDGDDSSLPAVASDDGTVEIELPVAAVSPPGPGPVGLEPAGAAGAAKAATPKAKDRSSSVKFALSASASLSKSRHASFMRSPTPTKCTIIGHKARLFSRVRRACGVGDDDLRSHLGLQNVLSSLLLGELPRPTPEVDEARDRRFVRSVGRSVGRSPGANAREGHSSQCRWP